MENAIAAVMFGDAVDVAVGAIAALAAHAQQSYLSLAGIATGMVPLSLGSNIWHLEYICLSDDGLRGEVLLVAGRAKAEREGIAIEFLAFSAGSVHVLAWM